MVTSLAREHKNEEYQILTRTEWERYYKSADIAKYYPIHCSLVNNESIGITKEKIEKFAKEKPSLLFGADYSFMKLTPLMIASMKANRVAVELLLKYARPEDLNAQDVSGYTAAHHAAPHPEIFNLIKQAGADMKKINVFNGTPEDLQTLINPPKPITSKHVFVHTDEGMVTIDQLIANNQLTKVTNFKEYQDFQRAPSTSWRKLWLLPYTDFEGKMNEDENKLQGISKIFERKGSLKLFSKLFNGDYPQAKIALKKHPKIPNFGAFATEEGIKFKANLGLFGGKIEENETEGFYSEGIVNAEEIGNVVSRINNGFPNNYTFAVPVKGTIYSFLLVTQPEGIAPHEELLSTWGLAYSEELGFRQPYTVLGVERMVKFYAKGVKPIFAKLKQWESKFLDEQVKINDEYLAFCDMRDKLYYVLENPTAMLTLHYLGIVPIADWLAIISDPDPPEFIDYWNFESKEVAADPRFMLLKLMDLIIETDKALNSNLKKLTDKWILENLSKVGLIKLSKALLLIKNSSNTLNNEIAWEIFVKTTLTPFMTNKYDWKNDDNNPITPKKMDDRKDDK